MHKFNKGKSNKKQPGSPPKRHHTLGTPDYKTIVNQDTDNHLIYSNDPDTQGDIVIHTFMSTDTKLDSPVKIDSFIRSALGLASKNKECIPWISAKFNRDTSLSDAVKNASHTTVRKDVISTDNAGIIDFDPVQESDKIDIF